MDFKPPGKKHTPVWCLSLQVLLLSAQRYTECSGRFCGLRCSQRRRGRRGINRLATVLHLAVAVSDSHSPALPFGTRKPVTHALGFCSQHPNGQCQPDGICVFFARTATAKAHKREGRRCQAGSEMLFFPSWVWLRSNTGANYIIFADRQGLPFRSRLDPSTQLFPHCAISLLFPPPPGPPR